MQAETVADIIFRAWVKRYGCPIELHSDQGRQYEKYSFQNMCELLEIKKTRTTPLHPRSDGMIERKNRTIQDILSKYIKSHQRDWDQHLDFLTMAYNSTPHERNEIPLDVISERIEQDEPQTEFASDYANKLEEKLREAHKIAREHLKVASERQKFQYDENVKEKYILTDTISKSPQKPQKKPRGTPKLFWAKAGGRKTEAHFPHLKLISISRMSDGQENQNSGKDKHYTTRKGRQIKVPEKFKDFIATMSSAKLFDYVDCGKEYCRCCPYEDCTKMYCRIEYMTYHLEVKHKLSSEQAKRKSKSCPVVRKSRTEFEESRRSTVSLQNAIPDSPPEAQIELENQYQVPDVLDILVNNNEFDNIEDLIGEVSEIRDFDVEPEANEFNLEGFFDDNCDSRDVSINVSTEGCSDNVMNTPTYCVPDNIQENNININNRYEDISSPENLEEFTCTNDDQMETGLEDLVYESDDNASICSSQKSTSTDSSNTKDEIVESVEIISISLIKTVTEVAGVKQVRTEQKFSFTGCDEPQRKLPAWAVNKVTQIMAPKVITRIHKACLSYQKWKSTHNPTFKPWLNPEQMTLPRLNMADIKPLSEFNSLESLDESCMKEEDIGENDISDEDSSD
ncbi:unnamed protein product [Mytilus coruscus]|uniref:Integrase catalytic domain-containing protein n=1 Tax=Mytilus coruscus TaxID=42192 RepID=A0A6J8A9M0_MYTCO|nr:unnamed protein product [Mytilus coruscus]